MTQKQAVCYHKAMATSKVCRNIRRSTLISMLGGVCSQCGTTDNLEFDHINRSTKSFTIGSNLDASIYKLLPELEKCQLLCHEHHMDKTLRELGKKRLGGGHGTLSRYRNNGCRCELCTLANREYQRPITAAYRERKKLAMII